MDVELLAVVLCLIGSAFFSSSETALTALPITRLEAMLHRSGRLARKGLERWARNPQQLLITILVGNNLVNVLASALATRISYRLTQSTGLASVVGIMTLVILVFGEITPKSLAQMHAQWFAARVAPLLYILDLSLRPVTWVLGLLTRLLSRRRTPEVPVTEEDVVFMLRLAHHHAQLPAGAHQMIESVLRFHQALAREVMVPRPRVVTVDRSWEEARVQEAFVASGHSRLPVVEGSPDAVVGVLHAKHLLHLSSGERWQELIAPPLFIPEAKPLPDLLQDFRRTRRQLAVVLDEFGGFAGVVTLEDALELVTGEIEDEFDRETSRQVVALEDGWMVPGHLSLRRLERALRRRLESPEGIDSIGGLMTSLTGDEAPVGTTVSWSELKLEVVAVERGRPSRILVRRATEPRPND